MYRGKAFRFLFAAMVFLTAGCVRDTYDMDKFSNRAHISPSMVISAVYGDVAFSDIVGPTDTVVFGSENFVTLIFRRDSVINVRPSDFTLVKLAGGSGSLTTAVQKSSQGPAFGGENAYLGQWVAEIDPDTLDLGIADILSHITGELLVSDPQIRLSYKNSFVDPMQIDFEASGKRQSASVDLNLAPFSLLHPDDTLQPAVSADFIIDKNNSALQSLISLPPEMILFSGKTIINVSSEYAHSDLFGNRSLLGSLEVSIPLRLRADNIQYTDTTDNFLADAFNEGSDLNWSDFKLFRVDFDVKNGFPFDVSLGVSLVDSLTHSVISTIECPDVLAPAPVDQNGKSSSVAASKASLTFTREFCNSISRSDKIIFRFIMNTTDSGSREVKIYSDYRLDFKASLILNPDINFEL